MRLLIFLFISNLSIAQTLTRFTGQVFLNSQKVQSPQVVKTGDLILADGKKSFFVLEWPDGSKEIHRNGSIKIEEQNVEKRNQHILRGLTHFFVNPKTSSQYNVSTNSTVMGVRGTKFFIQESKDETYLCVCSGKVQASNQKGLVDVLKGDDLIVEDKNSPLKTTRANKIMWKMALEGFRALGEPLK